MPGILHNLISVAALLDTGCTLHFYKHCVEIEYEGEMLYRGWRDPRSKLWRISLSSEGGQKITPPTAPEEYNDHDGIIIEASINAIYECEGKEQLTK